MNKSQGKNWPPPVTIIQKCGHPVEWSCSIQDDPKRRQEVIERLQAIDCQGCEDEQRRREGGKR